MSFVDVEGASLEFDGSPLAANEVSSFSYNEATEERELNTWATYPNPRIMSSKITLSGQFVYYLQSDAAPLRVDGVAKAMEVTATGFHFSGNVLITQVSVELNVDGEVQVTVDWKADGAYTIDTAAA